MLGHKATYTIDGHETIVKYQASYEKGVPYDIVIVDLTIPGGMGGQEATREILMIDSQAKIIVSSGYVTDPVIERGKRRLYIDGLDGPARDSRLVPDKFLQCVCVIGLVGPAEAILG